ncbi:MAG: DUF4381 domain-containing protein [Pseudomonadota bacterium]
MSAPALPDIFGNYVLGEDFVEVVPPESVSWLPQTAGWGWLGALLAILLARYLWQKLNHWYRNRYRREAAAKLKALSHSSTPDTWLADINALLKLAALVAFGRERVASLSGRDWVNFLNDQCPQPPFCDAQAALLSDCVYTGEMVSDAERTRLIIACREWLMSHEEPQDA